MTRMKLLRPAACIAVTALAFHPGLLTAQDQANDTAASTWTADMVPVDPFAAPAPFGPGEHLVYRVKVGAFNAGFGHMTVLGTEDVRENPSYRVEMGYNGGIGPLRVRDTHRSWFDVSTFQSWRFVQDLQQVAHRANRHFEMYPDSMIWHRVDTDFTDVLGSALPMDEIAFIYFMRTLDLEVGRTYTYHRYFKDSGNPIILEVLRKDQREIDGVTYNTIVIAPLIRSSGLFGEGGDAEIHLSDDDRRVLVYLKSNIPKFPGSLTLHLQSIQDGFPLNPASREQALEFRAAGAEAGSR